MSAERATWSPRVVASCPAGESVGRVLSVDVGVVDVLTRTGTVRAAFGSRLLGDLVRDPAAAPRPGDRVRLRTWVDGPVTIERVLARPAPSPGDAGPVHF